MASKARYYICTNGHKFGITSWGTDPLGCPRCSAGYKPAGRGGRKPPTAPMAIALKERSR